MNNEIFKSEEELMNFLLENNIVSEEILCECLNYMKFKIYKLGESKQLLYRCSKKGCQKRKSLLQTNIPLIKYISIVYWLLSSASYWQINIWSGVTDQTINNIKRKLRIIYGKYISAHPVFLGGMGVVVEVDESVLSRRGVISNPTSTLDNAPLTIWILGLLIRTKIFF